MGDKEGKGPSKIALILAHKEPDEDEGDEEKDTEASSDEVDALRTFDAAKSPKERASALKAFIKLCTEDY